MVAEFLEILAHGFREGFRQWWPPLSEEAKLLVRLLIVAVVFAIICLFAFAKGYGLAAILIFALGIALALWLIPRSAMSWENVKEVTIAVFEFLKGLAHGFRPALRVVIKAIFTLIALVGAFVPSGMMIPPPPEEVVEFQVPEEQPVEFPVFEVEDLLTETSYDVFQDRIRDPEKVIEIIEDVAQVYLDYGRESEFEEFAIFLCDLYSEIEQTLSDPEKRAPIVTEVLIVGPAASLGWKMLLIMLDRMKRWSSSTDNDYGTQIAKKLKRLLNYFKKVPKSRLAEISEGTGLPKKEVKALLRLGPFTHEASCFWSFAKLEMKMELL